MTISTLQRLGRGSLTTYLVFVLGFRSGLFAGSQRGKEREGRGYRYIARGESSTEHGEEKRREGGGGNFWLAFKICEIIYVWMDFVADLV